MSDVIGLRRSEGCPGHAEGTRLVRPAVSTSTLLQLHQDDLNTPCQSNVTIEIPPRLSMTRRVDREIGAEAVRRAPLNLMWHAM